MQTTGRHRWILWVILAGFSVALPLDLTAQSAPPLAAVPPVATAVPAPAGTLRLAFTHGGPLNFTAAFAADPDSMLASRLLSLTLRQAAESYEQTTRSNGTASLVIHLRAGLLWSDGSELVATDWSDALQEVYLRREARSVFFDRLAPLSIRHVDAPDARTLRIDIAVPLTDQGLATLSQISPLPMKLFYHWRELNQKGSLGTGKHAPSEYRMFQFTDSKPEALLASGPYRVQKLVPGSELVLSPNPNWRSPENPQPGADALPELSFVFLRGQKTALEAFAHAELDLLSAEDSDGPPAAPAGMQLRMRDWTPSGRTLSVIVNPLFVADKPWLIPAILGTNDSARAPGSTKLDIEVLFDPQKAERSQKLAQLANELSARGINIKAQPVPLADMMSRLEWDGDWQAMFLQLDTSPTGHAGREFMQKIAALNQTSIPVSTGIRYLWGLPNNGPVPALVAQSLLAYASDLY